MTVQLYEGCWGVTRGGEKPFKLREFEFHPTETEIRYIIEAGDGSGWREDGTAVNRHHGDIIAVFATEAEANAYLAGEPAKAPKFPEVGSSFDFLRQDGTWIKVRVVPDAPAPKPVTWPERRWEAMLVLAGGLASAIAEVWKRPGETQAQADARWCREHVDALLLAAADKVEGRG